MSTFPRLHCLLPLLAVFSILASASPAWTALSSSSLVCNTRHGWKTVQFVPTSTTISVTTTTLTKTETSLTTITITPPARTTTSISTVTTTTTTSLTSPVSMVISTSTSIVTATHVAPTSTSTETSTTTTTTTTTSTSVSTVPAPAGFTPVLDTLPGAIADLPAAPPQKRQLVHRSSQAPDAANKASSSTQNSPTSTVGSTLSINANAGDSQFGHLQAVTCTIKSTSTATITTTVTQTVSKRAPKPTSTVVCTSTVTVTITSTIGPSTITSTATVTITSTTTTTSVPITTTTTTSTSTTTTTSVLTQTTYAACSAENRIGNVEGGAIITIETANVGIENFTTIDGPTESYSCCVACFNTPLCASFWYNNRAQANGCVNVLVDSCTAPGQYVGDHIFFDLTQAPDTNFVLGNGNCVQFTGSGNANA